MSFTSLSVIISIIIALTVYRYSRGAYKKGLSVSLIGLSITLFSAIFAALGSVLVVKLGFDAAIGLIEDMDFYEDLSELVMGFESVLFIILKMLLSLVLYIPLFYLMRALIKLIVSIIYKCVCAKSDKSTVAYNKEGEDFYVKRNKTIAAFVGALTGIITCLVVFSPYVGAATIVDGAIDFINSSTDEEIISEDVEDYIRYFADDPAVSVLSACGSDSLFDFATAVRVDGERTTLRRELDILYGIDFNEFGDLVRFEEDPKATAEKIDALSKKVRESKILTLMFVDTISGISEAWLKYEDYLGAPRPEFGTNAAINEFIDELLYVCKDTTADTIAADVKTLVNIASMLMEEQALLGNGNYEDVVNALSDGGIIDNVKLELDKNLRMAPVSAALDNMLMSVFAEEITAIEGSEEFFESIANILNSTGSLTGTVRISAVTNEIKEALENNGVYLPEDLHEDVANKIINDIDSYGTGDITVDDVMQYFTEAIVGNKDLGDLGDIGNLGDISDYIPQN